MKRNGKIYRIVTVALVTVLLLTLTGCEKWDRFKAEFDLLRQEFPEIAEFFSLSKGNTDPSPYVVLALPDETASPMLDMLTHTEVIESPYNGADRIATVQSVGDASLGDGNHRTLTADEMALYTCVVRFEERAVEGVKAHFESCGIETEIVLRSNTAPAGEVFALNYAGVCDGEFYYVNPAVPVTLYVSAEKPATTAQMGKNVVYLTFDDGPSVDTGKLLDILDTYGVKAAFFTLGTEVEQNPSVAAEVIDRGHSLGCHSFSHDYEKIYSSSAALEAEVADWEAAVSGAGITLSRKLFRFPGGSDSGYLTEDKVQSMKAMLEGRGYLIYDWNVATNDAVLYLAPEEQSSYDYIRESFIASLEQRLKVNERTDGAPIIILMHEKVDETVALLPWIIEYLVDRGFVFGDMADFVGPYTFER